MTQLHYNDPPVNTGRQGLYADTTVNVSTRGNNESETDNETQVKIINRREKGEAKGVRSIKSRESC